MCHPLLDLQKQNSSGEFVEPTVSSGAHPLTAQAARTLCQRDVCAEQVRNAADSRGLSGGDRFLQTCDVTDNGQSTSDSYSQYAIEFGSVRSLNCAGRTKRCLRWEISGIRVGGSSKQI